MREKVFGRECSSTLGESEYKSVQVGLLESNGVLLDAEECVRERLYIKHVVYVQLSVNYVTVTCCYCCKKICD